MMTYIGIKTWIEENKQNVVIAICFVLVFIVGFGAGRFQRGLARNNTVAASCSQENSNAQTNYTTKTGKDATKTVEEQGTVETQVLGAAADRTCAVKGNISSTGGKIYHVAGGASYNTVKPEQCFKTEAEAKAAGFRKSSR